jgi:hypothetical protein
MVRWDVISFSQAAAVLERTFEVMATMGVGLSVLHSSVSAIAVSMGDVINRHACMSASHCHQHKQH